MPKGKSAPTSEASKHASQPSLSEREKRIIEQYRQQRQEAIEENLQLMEAFDQSRSEGKLLNALAQDSWKAIKDTGHLRTLRAMPGWRATFEEVSKLVKRNRERITDALWAAKFWADNTIGGREARSLGRILKKEKALHRKITRRSRKVLRVLEEYVSFLKERRNALFGSRSYERTATFIEKKMIPSVQALVEDDPTLHGTRVQSPLTKSPRNFAASIIVPLLRRRGYKQELALRACAELLTIVFPDLRTQLKDPRSADRLIETIRITCLRSVHPS